MKPRCYVTLLFLLFMIPRIGIPNPALEVGADEFYPHFAGIPIPLILATGEEAGDISSRPVTFALGSIAAEETLAECLPDYDINRVDTIVTAVQHEAKGLLDSIVLPEASPSVSQPLAEVNSIRFQTFNESQDKIYVAESVIGMAGLAGLKRTLIDHPNQRESVLAYLERVIEQVPRYNVLIQVEPFSTRYLNQDEANEVSDAGYQWIVWIKFGLFGYTNDMTLEEACALRFFYITGRTDFLEIVETPEILPILLLSDNPEDVKAGQIFLKVYTKSNEVLGRALPSVSDPAKWAMVYLHFPLTVAGRYSSRPEDVTLYSILTDDAIDIPPDLASRAAWYFAFTKSETAASYIEDVMQRYPVMDEEQTNRIIRALLLLPKNQVSSKFEGKSKQLMALLKEEGSAGSRYRRLRGSLE